MLDQISTLQNQQAALASRVESLSEASDAAETRERDAEARLDALLSQHARQISQRQVGLAKGCYVETGVFSLHLLLLRFSLKTSREKSSLNARYKN